MTAAESGRWLVKLKCQHCGKVFQATRGDAKYCSTRCRKQKSLVGQRLLSIQRATVANIHALLEYQDHPSFGDDIAAALGEIFDLVHFTDKLWAASAGGGDRAVATESVPGAEGTDRISSAGSVSEKPDMCAKLDLSVKSLEKRIERLEAHLVAKDIS